MVAAAGHGQLAIHDRQARIGFRMRWAFDTSDKSSFCGVDGISSTAALLSVALWRNDRAQLLLGVGGQFGALGDPQRGSSWGTPHTGPVLDLDFTWEAAEHLEMTFGLVYQPFVRDPTFDDLHQSARAVLTAAIQVDRHFPLDPLISFWGGVTERGDPPTQVVGWFGAEVGASVSF